MSIDESAAPNQFGGRPSRMAAALRSDDDVVGREAPDPWCSLEARSRAAASGIATRGVKSGTSPNCLAKRMLPPAASQAADHFSAPGISRSSPVSWGTLAIRMLQ